MSNDPRPPQTLDYSSPAKQLRRSWISEYWWLILCGGIILLPIIWLVYVVLKFELPDQK
jgi:hypothetical protein